MCGELRIKNIVKTPKIIFNISGTEDKSQQSGIDSVFKVLEYDREHCEYQIWRVDQCQRNDLSGYGQNYGKEGNLVLKVKDVGCEKISLRFKYKIPLREG